MKSLLNYIKEDVFDINKDVLQSYVGKELGGYINGSPTKIISISNGTMNISGLCGYNVLDTSFNTTREILGSGLIKQIEGGKLLTIKGDAGIDFNGTTINANDIHIDLDWGPKFKNININFEELTIGKGIFEHSNFVGNKFAMYMFDKNEFTCTSFFKCKVSSQEIHIICNVDSYNGRNPRPLHVLREYYKNPESVFNKDLLKEICLDTLGIEFDKNKISVLCFYNLNSPKNHSIAFKRGRMRGNPKYGIQITKNWYCYALNNDGTLKPKKEHLESYVNL